MKRREKIDFVNRMLLNSILRETELYNSLGDSEIDALAKMPDKHKVALYDMSEGHNYSLVDWRVDLIDYAYDVQNDELFNEKEYFAKF